MSPRATAAIQSPPHFPIAVRPRLSARVAISSRQQPPIQKRIRRLAASAAPCAAAHPRPAVITATGADGGPCRRGWIAAMPAPRRRRRGR
jgi:hypothetical protein